MSSWQQALAQDFRKGKRQDSCPVVMNRNQEKNFKTGREDADAENWTCKKCGHVNLGFYFRCEECGVLRPEEMATRMEMRAREGEIGRGGGFFQRDTAEERRSHDSDGEEFDDFGRRKRGRGPAGASAARPAAAAPAAAVPATRGGASERQKAALARLHAKSRGARASRSRSR